MAEGVRRRSVIVLVKTVKSLLSQMAKENFCGACMALPLAVAGAGATAIGANQSAQHKKRKKILLWSGIATVVLAVLLGIYMTFVRKGCQTCG